MHATSYNLSTPCLSLHCACVLGRMIQGLPSWCIIWGLCGERRIVCLVKCFSDWQTSCTSQKVDQDLVVGGPGVAYWIQSNPVEFPNDQRVSGTYFAQIVSNSSLPLNFFSFHAIAACTDASQCDIASVSHLAIHFLYSLDEGPCMQIFSIPKISLVQHNVWLLLMYGQFGRVTFLLYLHVVQTILSTP